MNHSSQERIPFSFGSLVDCWFHLLIIRQSFWCCWSCWKKCHGYIFHCDNWTCDQKVSCHELRSKWNHKFSILKTISFPSKTMFSLCLLSRFLDIFLLLDQILKGLQFLCQKMQFRSNLTYLRCFKILFCCCRYGEQAANATNEGLDAAGHAVGTAWAAMKIQKLWIRKVLSHRPL